MSLILQPLVYDLNYGHYKHGLRGLGDNIFSIPIPTLPPQSIFASNPSAGQVAQDISSSVGNELATVNSPFYSVQNAEFTVEDAFSKYKYVLIAGAVILLLMKGKRR